MIVYAIEHLEINKSVIWGTICVRLRTKFYEKPDFTLFKEQENMENLYKQQKMGREPVYCIKFF